MHAIRLHAFGPAENLTYEKTEDPVPGPGQVRIAVAAAGVHLLDTALREGLTGPFPAPAVLPTIPGREVAGTVDALGEGTDPTWLGKRVVTHLGMAPGGYAELAVADAPRLHEIPPTLDPAEAVAMIGTGRTTMGILQFTDLGPDSVAIVPAAAGGIGTLLVQYVKNMRRHGRRPGRRPRQDGPRPRQRRGPGRRLPAPRLARHGTGVPRRRPPSHGRLRLGRRHHGPHRGRPPGPRRRTHRLRLVGGGPTRRRTADVPGGVPDRTRPHLPERPGPGNALPRRGPGPPTHTGNPRPEGGRLGPPPPDDPTLPPGRGGCGASGAGGAGDGGEGGVGALRARDVP